MGLGFERGDFCRVPVVLGSAPLPPPSPVYTLRRTHAWPGPCPHTLLTACGMKPQNSLAWEQRLSGPTIPDV